MSVIQVNLTEDLISQAEQFVREGWMTDIDALMAEALRRYLESHGSALTEAFVREDVAWGLHGRQ